MKLAISTLMFALLLSCTAAFGQTTVELGFLSHDKQTQYCDYVQTGVAKNLVVTGIHFVTASGNTTCFNNGVRGVMAGLQTSFAANSGMLVTGTVATFADDTSDAISGFEGACGCSEYYVMKLRPSTAQEIEDGVYGWGLYTNFGGTTTLQNFGFTTKQLGNDNANNEASYDENL